MAGRVPKWGIRLPHVERRMFARIKRLEPADIRERITKVYHASIKIQDAYARAHANLEEALRRYRMDGSKKREEKIAIIERAVRKEDAVKLKMIKINMYYFLIGHYEYMLETKSASPFLSKFKQRQSNLQSWRKTAGNVLRQKRMEWEIKERGENPGLFRRSEREISWRSKNSAVMRRYVMKLINHYKNGKSPPPTPNGAA